MTRKGPMSIVTSKAMLLMLAAATIYSTALWIYYAVIADAITTVAHLLALLLGMGLSLSITCGNGNASSTDYDRGRM
jgi:hypothetical protein